MIQIRSNHMTCVAFLSYLGQPLKLFPGVNSLISERPDYQENAAPLSIGYILMIFLFVIMSITITKHTLNQKNATNGNSSINSINFFKRPILFIFLHFSIYSRNCKYYYTKNIKGGLLSNSSPKYNHWNSYFTTRGILYCNNYSDTYNISSLRRIFSGKR